MRSKNTLASAYPTPEHKTLDRHLLILDILRVAPHYLTAREIRETLEDQGVELSDRQVQRILKDYQDRFGLDSRTRLSVPGRPPLEWAWNRSKGPPGPQSIDPPTSLTFELAAQLLEPILPGPFMQHMESDLRRARQTLGQIGPEAQQLPKKLRVLPRGRGRLPANISPEVLSNVYHALLTERRIRVSYCAKAGEQISLATHELSPLGMIFRFDTLYLVHVCEPGSNQKDQNVAMEWPLHRFRSAQILNTPIRMPHGFDLDHHLKLSGFLRNQFLEQLAALGPVIELELLFSERTARYVLERPFSVDQRFRSQEDGRVLVTTTVPNTREVLSELLNFTDDVEVLSPEPLHAYFRDLAENLTRRYQKQESPC